METNKPEENRPEEKKKFEWAKLGTIVIVAASMVSIVVFFSSYQERIAKLEGYLLGRKEISEEKGKLIYPFPEYGVIIEEKEE